MPYRAYRAYAPRKSAPLSRYDSPSMREPQSPEQKARIIIHDEGAGVASPDVVEQRARELAIIAGRAGSDYTEEDFRQAKRELTQEPQPDDEEMEENALPFEPGSGDVLGGRESQAPNFGGDDETSIGEELVREGMDEALHDEMLEARKKDLRGGG
jgi:hypothetical protein